LDFPKTVDAPSPFDRSQECAFRIARDDVLKVALARRRQPIFELWSCILGAPPPVNGVLQFNAPSPDSGLTTLADSHARFMGIRRPCGEDGDGAKQLAYIIKPDCFYEYVPSPACLAKKFDVSADLVFVAYVRLDEPCTQGGHRVKGVLTHWHFVEADSTDATLPEDYQKRYDKRLW
jgi:hypothetical protein